MKQKVLMKVEVMIDFLFHTTVFRSSSPDVLEDPPILNSTFCQVREELNCPIACAEFCLYDVGYENHCGIKQNTTAVRKVF